MRFLGIESSTEVLSLGALDNEDILFSFYRRAERSASGAVDDLSRLLKKNRLAVKDFDCLVVGSGPGSFTGLRIAFSIVKAWNCALGIPVISLGSFLSVARKLKDQACRIAVFSDARKDMIYAATYGVRAGKVFQEKKEALYRAGDFFPAARQYLCVTYDQGLRRKVQEIYPAVRIYADDVWPDIIPLLKEGRLVYNKKKKISHGQLEPLYIHPQNCQVRNV